jgi:ribosomal protein RSM22 (predicted rRNA methylase)
MKLPAALQEAIEKELAACDIEQLRAASTGLTQLYRGVSGSHLPCASSAATMHSATDRAAYLAVRMPATFAAASAALAWTLEAYGGDEIGSMLDLGSGPGTALWAAAQQLPALEQCSAVERNPELIELGRRLAARSDSAAVRNAEWVRGDLTDWGNAALPGAGALPSGNWDLVVCCYALNEIGEAHRSELIRQAWARCSKLLLVVEPGTRAGFANVLAVRNQMLACESDDPGTLVLAAPCPHTLACPMATAGDWCHFAARVERTATHRRIKDATLGHEDEKFSYVAFAREDASPAASRIVRHPRTFSGYAQLTLCREGRLDQITVTRSQKEDWRRLKRLGWGDAW